MRIESNIKEVVKQLKDKLDFLSDVDLVVSRGAANSVAVIKSRVQQQGKETNGAQIDFSGRRQPKDGAYSQGYAKLRRKKGLQTSKIDLTFSGDMMRAFQPIPIDQRTYGVGFLNDEAKRKADRLEERFGEIFAMSDSELRNFYADALADIIRLL